MPVNVPSFEEFDEFRNDVEAHHESVDADLDSLQTNLDSLTYSVSGNNHEIEQLQNRVNSLEASHQELLDRVVALENGEGGSVDPTNPEETVPLVGLTAGYVQGATWPAAINASINTIQRPLDVRRCFDPGVPSSFSSSQLRHDNGDRVQVWSFKPSPSTTVASLVNLFQSIPDRSRVYVTPYHEPRDNMSASAYLSLYAKVRQAYDTVGGFAGMGPILTNWGIDHANELDYVPATGVDFLGIDPYVDLEASHGETIAESAATAIGFCNARGIPLGIGEYGVDANASAAWKTYHSDWIRSFVQLPEFVEVNWILYWNDVVGNFDCRLNSNGRVNDYRYVYDAFNA